MNRPALVLLGVTWLAGTLGTATQDPPAVQQPTFRTRIELARLEVSVLDRERTPIHGLQASDFKIEIDGVLRPVVAVDEVILSSGVDDRAAPLVGSPATTNNVADARVFVIIMDDGQAPGDPWMARNARQAAQAFVRGLAPGDLVSVVYTWDIHKGQEFTADHELALTAIDRFKPGPPGPPNPLAMIYSRRTVQHVMASLFALPGHRRAVVLVSYGLPEPKEAAFGGFTADDDLEWTFSTDEIVAMTGRPDVARIPIYAIDIAGLTAPTDVRRPGLVRWSTARQETLTTLASLTGGMAVTNTNDPLPGVKRILRENASYYVLGYEPPATSDRRSQRIKVSLSDPRKGTVLVRQHTSPSTEESPHPLSLTRALGGFLPASGVPVRMIARAFPVSETPALVVALRVGWPPGDRKDPSRLAVEWRVFDERSQVHVEQRELSGMELISDQGESTVFLRTSVKPGRYHVRAAVRGDNWRIAASVFGDVIVPDFRRSAAASELLLLAPASSRVPPSMADLVPSLPSFDLTFTQSDRLRALFNVPPSDAVGAISAEIQTASGAVVRRAREAQPIPARGGAQIIEFALRDFAPGRYRLVVHVTSGAKSTTTSAAFVIR